VTTKIIPPECLQHTPPGIQDILLLVQKDASTIYIREPLPPRQDHINILLHNLQNSNNPTSINFNDLIVKWYSDLLLGWDQATNTTGCDNQIFTAYGLTSKIQFGLNTYKLLWSIPLSLYGFNSGRDTDMSRMEVSFYKPYEPKSKPNPFGAQALMVAIKI
jgi:hypothetical protein